jgi:hypothetical protein
MANSRRPSIMRFESFKMAASKEKMMASRILHITDTDQKPHDFLRPINGNETMSLVRLEKAVEELVDFVPSIRSYVY